MLTPAFRRLLRIGVPVAVVALAAAVFVSDPARVARVQDEAARIRAQIETRPEFMVTTLDVTGASAAVADALRAQVEAGLPASSFHLDLDAIRLSAEEVDAVAAAAVRVRAGGVLQIDVTERVPAIVWRGREGLWLLDGEGARVAPVAARADRADLPLMVGEGAPEKVAEALALLAVADPIAPRLRGLLRVGDRRWDIVLDPDIRILLPETDAVSALDRVIALHEVHDLLSRDISVVDLRNPDRPTVRLRPDAARTFRDTVRASLEALRP